MEQGQEDVEEDAQKLENIQAEAERKQEEADRKQEEAAEAKVEADRIQAEANRKQAEVEQKQAEARKLQAEASKLKAQAAIIQAEADKKTAETKLHQAQEVLKHAETELHQAKLVTTVEPTINQPPPWPPQHMQNRKINLSDEDKRKITKAWFEEVKAGEPLNKDKIKNECRRLNLNPTGWRNENGWILHFGEQLYKEDLVTLKKTYDIQPDDIVVHKM